MCEHYYWLNYLVKYKLLKRKNPRLEKILGDMNDPRLWLRDGFRLCNPNNRTFIWVANDAYGVEVLNSTTMISSELEVPPEYKYLIWRKYQKLRFQVVRVGSIFNVGEELIVKPMHGAEYEPATEYLAKANKHLEEIENVK